MPDPAAINPLIPNQDTENSPPSSLNPASIRVESTTTDSKNLIIIMANIQVIINIIKVIKADIMPRSITTNIIISIKEAVTVSTMAAIT